MCLFGIGVRERRLDSGVGQLFARLTATVLLVCCIYIIIVHCDVDFAGAL